MQPKQTNKQASRARHRLRPRLTAKVQTWSCMFGHVPSRRISASPCSHARQGERWPLASSTQGCCHPDRPASDDRCVCPLWRTQLGSGKTSSSNSSSRTSRTSSSCSSSSNSDKTRQGKTTHVFPVIPRRTDTLGKFRTYKNAGRHINVPKHVFQNTTWTQHAPTSRNLSPQLSTQQSKWTHWVSKWGVSKFPCQHNETVSKPWFSTPIVDD